MNAVIHPQGVQIWCLPLPLMLSRIRALAGHNQHCSCPFLCCKHTGHEGTDTGAEIAQKYRIWWALPLCLLCKTPATLFKLLLLSRLLDKYYRTAFQPGSFDENLDFEVWVLLLKWGSRRQSHNTAPPGPLLSVETGKQLGSPLPSHKLFKHRCLNICTPSTSVWVRDSQRNDQGKWTRQIYKKWAILIRCCQFFPALIMLSVVITDTLRQCQYSICFQVNRS